MTSLVREEYLIKCDLRTRNNILSLSAIKFNLTERVSAISNMQKNQEKQQKSNKALLRNWLSKKYVQ